MTGATLTSDGVDAMLKKDLLDACKRADKLFGKQSVTLPSDSVEVKE